MCGWYCSTMQTMQCEAIVLGATDYRESDRIATFFTLEHGKLKGIARGAKKSVRRFGGALELFARLKLQLGLQEGLAQVHGADIVTIFPHIREELSKIGHASYACELTDLFMPEGMSNPRFFRLLAAYLEHLDSTSVSPSDRRFFEINTLNILGYRPLLTHCVSCGSDLAGASGPCRISSAGSVLCDRCGRRGRTLSAPTIALLTRAMQTGRFGAIIFPPDELAEAGELLDAAISSHLGRPLRSLSFLREMGE
ncbi:MAG: DNA repair protein RecO [Geobacteraceae bacterium]|nr:MAG: DNA repair protein RecO [Geobacteraceae bacterium]